MRVLGQVVLFVVGVALLGGGVPVGWVWVASQLQDNVSGRIDPLAAFVLLAGIPSTYAALTGAAHVALHRSAPAPRRRAAWNRPLGGDRPPPQPTSWIETLFVTTTLVVALVVEVYLVFFAHPGVPSGL